MRDPFNKGLMAFIICASFLLLGGVCENYRLRHKDDAYLVEPMSPDEFEAGQWQTIMPDAPPDVCGDMDQHLSEPGNWVRIETQVNDDCGRRYILELGTGPIEGIEIEVGPEPTPAPCPFNIDPNFGIDPDEVGGAF